MRPFRSARRVSHFFRLLLLELETRLVPSLVAPLAFDAGSGPYSVAVGDFNGDGIQDLAVANFYSANVSVLLGNGDGSFQPARSFDAGSFPGSVAVGDFNGDGILDLAVADYWDFQGNGGSVSVLLGNGDGSFQPARSFATGRGPVSVAVGDINGDGILDLAVADHGDSYGNGGGVSVLLGKGDGSFQPDRSFPAGVELMSVAVGDFNGDGIQDLAVANETIFGSVSVLLGNGDGSFQPARSFDAGSFPRSVAVGDINGDGILDLAITTGNNDVRMLLGNGDGTFQAARSFAVSGIDFVTVADINGDGIPDLITTGSVLLGNGDGSFQLARTFAAGSVPLSVAVGDFNGDGIPDLAAANFDGGNASVLLGKGDGTFRAPRNFPAGNEPESVAVGDFNGDSIQDLAVANTANFFGPPSVSVLLGNGDGSFQAPRNFNAGNEPDSVAVGDFNGDGIPDLAVADHGDFSGNGSSVTILLGNGNGTFQTARTFVAGNEPDSVAVGDFNGDGIPDLAVANYGSNTVSVLLGNGDGTFQPARSFAVGTRPESVAVGDFNGDGFVDLAVPNRGTNPTDGSVSVLLGNGDGTFQPARSFNAGRYPGSVVVGDFNGDGLLDLIVGTGAGVSVLLGNGDGNFRAAVNYAAEGWPVAVADVNGDGLPDLALVGAGGVQIFLGNGDGTFQTTNFSYIAGSVPAAVAVADFNGDGWPDLAVANNYSNDVSILLNDGAWTGPHPGPGGGAPRRLDRGAGVPNWLAEHHPAAVVEAQLAEAAVPDLRLDAPAEALAEPAPALPPQSSVRLASFATPASPPRREESPPVTRARPAALAPPQAILDLVFADALTAGSDSSLTVPRQTRG